MHTSPRLPVNRHCDSQVRTPINLQTDKSIVNYLQVGFEVVCIVQKKREFSKKIKTEIVILYGEISNFSEFYFVLG